MEQSPPVNAYDSGGFAMGIWLELGIFVVVLIFGIWQIRDAKRAHARSVAERLAREADKDRGEKPGH
jgi:heme exporter protein D